MRRKIITSSVFLIIVLLLSCSRRPGNVLSEKELEAVLYDVQLAQAVYMTQGIIYDTPGKKDALVNSALAKYDLTQADFDSTLVWYSDNDIQKYTQINDSVSARLRRETNKLRELSIAKNNRNTFRPDQVLPLISYLDKKNPVLSFDIDSIRLKTVKPEYFKWSFSILGLSEQQDLRAGIVYTYKDTVVSQILPINSDKQYEMHKPNLPDSLLKNISGYIRLQKSRVSSDIIIYNIHTKDSISSSSTDKIGDIKKPNTELRSRPPGESIGLKKMEPEKDKLKEK